MTNEKRGRVRGNFQVQVGSFQLNTGPFELPLQGITAIFGRSGSGKSTFLRVLGGLASGVQGRLDVEDDVWLQGEEAKPAQLRNIGFVFQDAALFPHLNVEQNLAFAVRRIPKNQKQAPKAFSWQEVIERIGLTDLLTQSVSTLSGGERQRVAIARALLMQPKWLCMDEPLSALDWTSKAELLRLIEDVVADFHIPVLYVTHSPSEVERLADRVLFMENGRVERIETLKEALSRADSPLFVDQGALSLLEGKPTEPQEGLTPVRIGNQTLWLAHSKETDLTQQDKVRVRVLARDVSLALVDPQQVSILNHLSVTVSDVLPYSEHHALVRCALDDGQTLFAEVTHRSVERLQLTPNKTVFALIKSVALSQSLPTSWR